MKPPRSFLLLPLFLAGCVSLSSCRPPAKAKVAESVSVNVEVRPDGLTYAHGSAAPFSGEVVRFTGNLGRISVETYQDGKPHGVWQRFWSNGQVKREERYAQGSKVHERQWYEDGVLKSEASMRNGIGYGRINLWWPDGRIRRTSWVGENLRPHGHALEYDEKGNILTDAIFDHGVYISGKLREEPVAKPVTAQAH